MILEGKRILVTGRGQPPLDRLRDRRAGPAGGRRGGADQLRPRPPDDRARREAPPGAARRARARRQRRRRPAALREELAGRWGRVDGGVHAIAFAPADALGGDFLGAPRASASAAFETSAYSLKALAEALAPLMRSDGNGNGPRRVHRRPRLRRLGRLAGLRLDGRRQGGARVRLALSGARPRAARHPRQPGLRRSDLDAGGLGHPRIRRAGRRVGRAAHPLGWDTADASPVADAALFLLSDLARGISGEIVHVDGGVHAVGAAVGEATRAKAH